MAVDDQAGRFGPDLFRRDGSIALVTGAGGMFGQVTAIGLARLAILLSGDESLRDVIPFPKTQTGTDLITDAQNLVSAEQLAELRIRTVGEKE